MSDQYIWVTILVSYFKIFSYILLQTYDVGNVVDELEKLDTIETVFL